MSTLSVPRELLASGPFSQYTDAGDKNKAHLHTKGKTFLKSLAKALALKDGSYDIRSNRGGIAVSGEVTLHSDDIYIQISESFSSPGLQILFRTCSSRKDYCGNQNHFIKLESLREPAGQERFLKQVHSMIGQERARKTPAASPAPQAAARTHSPSPVSVHAGF